MPPVGWADVATKLDLHHVEERLGLRIELTEQRLTATLHEELQHQQRFFVTAMLAWGSVLVTIAFAVGRIT